MATPTRGTARDAAPKVVVKTQSDNPERERVFNLFRQYGYLEAELNPPRPAAAAAASRLRDRQRMGPRGQALLLRNGWCRTDAHCRP